MSDMTLERMKVVVGADTKVLESEMKKAKEVVREETKEVETQNKAFKKSVNEQISLTQKLRAAMSKANGATYGKLMNALKLPSTKAMEQERFKNPLSENKNFSREQFKNPLSRTLGSQKELRKEIDATEQRMQELIKRRDELERSGVKTGLAGNVEEISKGAEEAKRKLDKLIEKKERLEATGGMTNKQQANLDYDILRARKEFAFFRADEAAFRADENYQKADEWAALNREIKDCDKSLKEYRSQEKEVEKSSGFERLKKQLSSVRDGIKKVSSAVKKLFKRNNGSGGIGQLFKRTALRLLIFSAFRSITSGIKEGMQNLAKYSNQYGTQFNKSMTLMYSSLKQLQNAFATAFAPIVNVVAPYIATLIQHLTAGANALAQFFSALTGSDTWTRAKYNTQNYAESLDKASGSAKKLKNELYGFDEITKQSDNSSSSGNGVAVGDMFTEETVNNQFSNFASRIKEAWKNADFTSIGKTISDKLTDTLDKIRWNDVYATVGNFGKSLATFLNGLITPDLFGAVGRTIAGVLNTAIQGALSFGENLDWKQVGESIGTGINNFFKTFDFKKLGKGLSTFAGGLMNGIQGAIETIDWNEIGQSIVDFICGIDWESLAWNFSSLSTTIYKKMIDSISIPILKAFMKPILVIKKWFYTGLLGVSEEMFNQAVDDMYKDANNFYNDTFSKSPKEKWDNLINKVTGSIPKGKKTATIPISLEVDEKKSKENVSSGISSISKQVPDVTTGVSTETDPRNLLNSFYEYGRRNPLKTAVETTNNATSVWKPYSNQFSENNLKTGVKLTTTGRELYAPIDSTFRSNPLSVDVKTTPAGKLFSALQEGFTGKALSVAAKLTVSSIVTKGGMRLETKAGGGLFSGGRWHPITAYADGGTPGTGQLFLARESGPELVGTIGGHTAVMNNGQIVSSVTAGVESGVVRAMMAFTGQQRNEEPVVEVTIKTDDETLYRRVLKGKQKSDRRYHVVTEFA